jgi:hypothetical protein
MSRANRWNNPDGLLVGFGTHSADNDVMAAHAGGGALISATGLWNLVDIEDTDSITIASYNPQALVIPRGSWIARATLRTTVAITSSNSAVLDIGLYDADFSSVTVDDADGIDADIAITAHNALGEMVECDGALVNGVIQVGATSDSDCVVILGWDAFAYTAGQVELTIEYLPPLLAGRTIAN